VEIYLQTRSEETRRHILAAALELFSRDGYDATSVAEICRAAGVSKGAFYHHFPSKQSVFLELLNDWVKSISSQVEMLEAGGSVPENFLRMSKLMEGVFRDASGRVSIFLEFWRQANRSPEIWQSSIKPFHTFQDFFASLVQKGIDEGSFRSVDPRLASQLIVSTAVGLLLQGVIDPESANWGMVASDSFELLIKGFERE